MSDKDKEKSNIFDRILALSEIKGYKSLRDFSVNGLGYKGSEKLNRLKKKGAAPSIDILLDISNKFSDVSLDWLIVGRGNVIRSTKDISNNIVAGSGSINIAGPKNGNQKIIDKAGFVTTQNYAHNEDTSECDTDRPESSEMNSQEMINKIAMLERLIVSQKETIEVQKETISILRSTLDESRKNK